MKRTKPITPPHKVEDYLDMIRSLAWSFHRNSKIEYNDLFSEGCLRYCETSKQYDPEKGKFGTYIYRAVANRMIDYVKQEQKFRYNELEEYGISVEDTTWCIQPSEDILEVLASAINMTKDLAQIPPKLARGEVYRSLREKNWSWPRIWKAMRDTKENLNQIDLESIIVEIS